MARDDGHPRVRAAGAALAAAVVSLAPAACGGGSGAAAASRPAGAHPGASASPAAAPAASPVPVATSAVDIANFAFSPAVITVRVGQTVTWTNRDEDAHTVALTGAPVSGPMQNGETYTFTFIAAGTYRYVCSIHPSMHGMVVVSAG